MKKTLLQLSLLIVFSTQAQQAPLWKITPKNGKNASYIFGTVHATCDATLPKSVLNALDQTKQLCLELDMDDPNLQTQTMSEGNMKGNTTLSSLISKSDAKILNDYFIKNIGAPIEALNQLKPFFISSMFIQKMLDCQAQSFEQELMKVSLEQKEAVIGLETIATQMNLFDKIPYQFQAEELVNSIKDDFLNDKKELEQLTVLYKEGDLDGMMKLNENSTNELTKKYGNLLIDERNLSWISSIEKITKETPTFFGVGALHLPGKNGLLQLLKDHGFTVERVN